MWDLFTASFRTWFIGVRDKMDKSAELVVCQEGNPAAAKTEDFDSFIFLVFAWCVLFTKRATFIRMDTAAVLLRAPSSLGVRVVLVSDTHGMHRTLDMPDGDILIHGGDFTRFGKREDAVDFNLWLGDLPYAHRFVVLGNPEATAEWREDVAEILSNAVLLCDSGVSVPLPAPLPAHQLQQLLEQHLEQQRRQQKEVMPQAQHCSKEFGCGSAGCRRGHGGGGGKCVSGGNGSHRAAYLGNGLLLAHRDSSRLGLLHAALCEHPP